MYAPVAGQYFFSTTCQRVFCIIIHSKWFWWKKNYDRHYTSAVVAKLLSPRQPRPLPQPSPPSSLSASLASLSLISSRDFHRHQQHYHCHHHPNIISTNSIDKKYSESGSKPKEDKQTFPEISKDRNTKTSTLHGQDLHLVMMKWQSFGSL